MPVLGDLQATQVVIAQEYSFTVTFQVLYQVHLSDTLTYFEVVNICDCLCLTECDTHITVIVSLIHMQCNMLYSTQLVLQCRSQSDISWYSV